MCRFSPVATREKKLPVIRKKKIFPHVSFFFFEKWKAFTDMASVFQGLALGIYKYLSKC